MYVVCIIRIFYECSVNNFRFLCGQKMYITKMYNGWFLTHFICIVLNTPLKLGLSSIFSWSRIYFALISYVTQGVSEIAQSFCEMDDESPKDSEIKIHKHKPLIKLLVSYSCGPNRFYNNLTTRGQLFSEKFRNIFRTFFF